MDTMSDKEKEKLRNMFKEVNTIATEATNDLKKLEETNENNK